MMQMKSVQWNSVHKFWYQPLFLYKFDLPNISSHLRANDLCQYFEAAVEKKVFTFSKIWILCPFDLMLM